MPLRGKFGDRVHGTGFQRDRFRNGTPPGVTVHGTGRGVHESGDAGPPRLFEHHQAPLDVHPGGGLRVQFRPGHRGERRQVGDPIHARKSIPDRGGIPDVSFPNLDARIPGDAVAPTGREVIQDPNPLANPGQPVRECGPDEPGATGDEIEGCFHQGGTEWGSVRGVALPGRE